MLFKILKLFGLDVPAKIEAVKASLEQRIDQATDHVKQVAQQAGVIAALSASAAVAAMLAIGIGLLALYWWTAENYGPFVGLAVVGGILIVATIALAAAAASKAKSLAPSAAQVPRHETPAAAAVGGPGVTAISATGLAGVSEPGSAEAQALTRPGPTFVPELATPKPATVADLVEPMALVLSKVVKYPSFGNPLIDQLIGSLQMSARDATGEAVERAANVVRRGDRVNMVLVLAGAAIVGWLMAHQSRR